MSGFVGRSRELRSLQNELERVLAASDGVIGRCILVRGRRRVGKSRLLEEFCARAGIPSVFFTASKQGVAELDLFADEVRQSDLPGCDLFEAARPTSWDGALQVLGSLLDQGPAIVVIDEFPYLVGDDPSIEATFQKVWDRVLSRKRVLLVLVGSDLAMMEALDTHGRAFFQRGTELVVPPLSPVETAAVVGITDAADAFDAHLLTGGLPLICQDWPTGASMAEFIRIALAEPTSPLIVSAERVLAAELPADVQARGVLGQIGAGEVTFARISRSMGGMQPTSLSRALDVLVTKRVVAKDRPLSTRPSRDTRYRVADPYLRFWLRFIGPHLPEIERGRSDRVVARIERDWTTWRGRAIEPVIREALSRLSPIPGLPDADVVGSYWTRTNVPDVDVIGADRRPIARAITYAGAIKWLERAPLREDTVRRLIADLASVPGASPSTPLVAVSRSGVDATGVVALGPSDLLAAWL